ncbi:MAG: hypothetical protein IJM30_05045, partial [Thermoguttaceae bacterium]|nr:hypothetical protein [Thermoguttaceae bacterium]
GSGAAPSVGAPSVSPRPVPAPSGGSSPYPPRGSAPSPSGGSSASGSGASAGIYDALIEQIAKQNPDKKAFLRDLKDLVDAQVLPKGLDLNAIADKYFPFVAPALENVDALGYGGALDLNDLQEEPQFGEDPASNAQAEKSRIRSQSFAEWVLQKRRYASNEHIKDLAKRYGINVNATHLADVREKMGIDFDPRRSRYADAYYRAQDFLEQSQEERTRDRADLEGMGKIKPDAGAGSRASLLERLNPRSRFNEEKRQTEEKLSKVLEDLGNALTEEEKNKLRERVDELEKKLEAYRKGIRPESSASEKDERSVERARNSLDELAKLYDPKTGKIDPNAKLSPETLALLNARRPEDVAVAFGNADASAAPASGRAGSSGSSGFGFVDRIRAGAARGRLRGEAIGKLAGGTVARGILGGAASGAARGGAIGAVVGAVIGGIASGVKQLVRTCRNIYRGVKESIAATMALAPFNGRLGAGRAQFEGREFSRKVRFAEGTSEARIKLLREQDKLAEETLELKNAFSNVGLFLQTVFMKALRGVVSVLNAVLKVGKTLVKFDRGIRKKAKGLIEKIPGVKSAKKGWRRLKKTIKDAPGAVKELWRSRKTRKEQNELQARQKDQNQIINEGNVARKFFETGEIDAEALAKTSWANMDKEAVKKMLGDKSKRDEFEDLIAYNDLNRGYGYFQGYQGIEGGAPKSQEDLKDILKVVQSIHLATLEQKQEAAKTRKAAEETAENTREKNQNIQQQPIFDAMKQIADRFKPTGNEKAYSGEYSGSWGAEQEKQYGRFAGESVETWGLERNAKGRSGR